MLPALLTLRLAALLGLLLRLPLPAWRQGACLLLKDVSNSSGLSSGKRSDKIASSSLLTILGSTFGFSQSCTAIILEEELAPHSLLAQHIQQSLMCAPHCNDFRRIAPYAMCVTETQVPTFMHGPCGDIASLSQHTGSCCVSPSDSVSQQQAHTCTTLQPQSCFAAATSRLDQRQVCGDGEVAVSTQSWSQAIPLLNA